MARKSQEPEEIEVSTNRTSGIPEGIHRFQVVDYEMRIGDKDPY